MTTTKAKSNFQKSFKERVEEVVRKIPKGKVLTYKQVSVLAGVAGAYRAVGSIMAKNADKNMPCHRVIKSDGSVGDYNGLQNAKQGRESKISLLKKEGIKFTESGKIVF